MPYIPLLINKNTTNNSLFIFELISLMRNRWALDKDKKIKVINPKRFKLILGKILNSAIMTNKMRMNS